MSSAELNEEQSASQHRLRGIADAQIIVNSTTGAGDATFPMLVSTVSMFVCRVALAYVLGVWLNMGVFGTWLAMFVDWLVKAVIFIWRYYSKRWMAFRVV